MCASKNPSHDRDNSALANAAPGQPQHQCVELWASQTDLRLPHRVGPGKVSLVQPPGGQPKANAIVHQHLHAVGTLVGKEVGAVGMGCAEDGDDARQARVKAASHVQRLRGKPPVSD